MPADWKTAWNPRAHDFNYACVKYPRARDQETDPLVDLLQIVPGIDFLEVAPCGGTLLRRVKVRQPTGVTYYAVEPSDENAKDLPQYVSRVKNSDITSFKKEDGSVDRVGNLAGLHHTDPRDMFFTESYRVLRPGGILAAADVAIGSPVADWLNEFVNEHCSLGHEGVFFGDGEMTKSLKAVGFSQTTEEIKQLFWRFRSPDEAIEFCQNLFYLDKADKKTILLGLDRYLGIEIDSDEVRIPWQLVYASGRK